MNLLIITQKVDKNSSVLGFFTGWIVEFAKNFDKVTVICLYKGEYDLPDNVKVLSLGKEKNYEGRVGHPVAKRSEAGVSDTLRIISKLKYIYRFYKYIWQERKNYDKVFVHMNQIYVILGGLFWKIFRKDVGLWYAHGSVPFGLRIANLFVDHVFTSTESGFRLNSKKKKVVGQGIDTEVFKPNDIEKNNNVFEIVSVGRISEVKDYLTLIKAINLLKNDFNLKLNIIGGTIYDKDVTYKKNLEDFIEKNNLGNLVNFVGSVPNYKLAEYLQKNDLFVNTSHTGSLDKTVLEAMATGLPVLNCNEALLEVFGEFTNDLMFEKGDFEGLSVKIKEMFLKDSSDRNRLGLELREIARKEHSIDNLIKKIKREYE